MKLNNLREYGFMQAIRGMRFAKDSENLSDSNEYSDGRVEIGDKDLALMLKLIKAGRSHRKFLRFIQVQFEMEMPLSWWKQFDQYKIATVSLSRSTMHRFGYTNLSKNNFETNSKYIIETIIPELNKRIENWRETKNYAEWKEAIDILPSSFLQERAISCNYEVLIAICLDRKGEKLTKEWNFFIDEILSKCTYLIIFLYNLKKGEKQENEIK